MKSNQTVVVHSQWLILWHSKFCCHRQIVWFWFWYYQEGNLCTTGGGSAPGLSPEVSHLALSSSSRTTRWYTSPGDTSSAPCLRGRPLSRSGSFLLFRKSGAVRVIFSGGQCRTLLPYPGKSHQSVCCCRNWETSHPRHLVLTTVTMLAVLQQQLGQCMVRRHGKSQYHRDHVTGML